MIGMFRRQLAVALSAVLMVACSNVSGRATAADIARMHALQAEPVMTHAVAGFRLGSVSAVVGARGESLTSSTTVARIWDSADPNASVTTLAVDELLDVMTASGWVISNLACDPPLVTLDKLVERDNTGAFLATAVVGGDEHRLIVSMDTSAAGSPQVGLRAPTQAVLEVDRLSDCAA